MKVAIVGASGRIGSRIAAEAANRSHSVTAIGRNPDNLPKHKRISPIRADVLDSSALARTFTAHDAIIHSYSPPRTDSIADRIAQQRAGTTSIIAAARSAGVDRILAIGGAGTLLVDGVLNMDRLEFPAAWEGGAKSTALIKDLLKAERGLIWTFLCPAHDIVFDGERTGVFRLGLDELIRDREGRSRISCADLAVAMIDELEQPKHSGRRFTVGY